MTPALEGHLRTQLGAWPPAAPVVLAASAARVEPGWDGAVRRFAGVRSPLGTVLSVPPDVLAELDGASGDSEDAAVAAVEACLRGRVVEGFFRWSAAPRPLDPLGAWVPAADERVPEWLKPFGGDVLVHLEGGRYVGGVGIKRHDDHAWEISVGTEPEARGQGVARRLVATAARAIVETGRVATYLHEPANHASGRVAEASGFPDRGWRWLFLVPHG